MNEQFVHRFKFTFGLRNLIECCPADTSSLVSFGSAHLSSSLSTCWRTSFTLTIHLTSLEINVIARTVDEVWRLQISWCQGNLKEDNFEKFTNRFPVKNETVGQDGASIREIFTSKRFVIGRSTCEVATYANEKPSSSVNEAAQSRDPLPFRAVLKKRPNQQIFSSRRRRRCATSWTNCFNFTVIGTRYLIPFFTQ